MPVREVRRKPKRGTGGGIGWAPAAFWPAFRVLCNTVLIAYIVVPILLILIGSFGRKWFGTLLPEGFTVASYVELFSKRMYLKAMRMSLFLGLATVLVNLALSIPAVYAVYMLGSRRLKQAFNGFMMLPVAIPPLVMGMGLIQAYNWPWFSLVGTWQLLLIAHVIYTIPFTVRPIMANMELIAWNSLEQAAESLGAGRLYAIFRVLIPNLQPGILAGIVMTLAMSLGEFQLAVLLSGSATQTYPVTLYQAFYVSTGFACAATMLLVVMAVVALWLTSAFTRILRINVPITSVGGGAV
ncbi:MAG TPA: ABC transporter permease subunit [Firmicutes bacterium]|nr:ABC transporter permease subunit [Bacillota bacterium]